MIGELIQAMAFVLGSWAVVAAACVGAGWLLERGFAGSGGDDEGLLRWFWLGIAAWVVLAQIWNFWFPMNSAFAVTAGMLGALGLIFGRVQIAAALRRFWRDTGPAVGAALALIGLWCANRGMGPPGHIDAGLYHLGAVRWYASSALPPGLGNLIDTIGFNNANHLLHATLEGSAGFWQGRSFHVIHSLMAATLLWRAGIGAARLARTGFAGRGAWVDAYYLLTITPVVGVAISNNISSPTTDWPGMAAAFVGTAELLALVLSGADDRTARHRHMLAAVVLLTLSVTFKVTHIWYGAAGCAVALGVWAHSQGTLGAAVRGRAGWAAVLLAALLLVPWAARSVVISGYVVYPVLVSKLNVDWAVPSQQAALTGRWAKASGRGLPSSAEAGTPWIASWVRWQFKSINPGLTVLPALIALVAGLALVARRAFARRATDGVFALAALLAAPGIIALLAWFAQGPQPRMGGFLLWSLAGLLVALAWGAVRPSPAVSRGVVTAAIAMGLAPIGVFMLLSAQGKITDRGAGGGSPLYVAPGPDMGLHPAARVPLEEFRTASGLRLRAPTETLGCGDAPLPASQMPSRQIEARDPADLARGFRYSAQSPPRPSSEEIRAAWAVVRADAKPGDALLAGPDAAALVADAMASGELPAFLTMAHADAASRDLSVLLHAAGAVPGGGRVWYIHADGPLGPTIDERGTMLVALGTRGNPVRIVHIGGMGIGLFALP